MKKTLFFSSMLATLATAGSALMMTAAPVMAAEKNSDLLMNVTAGNDLSLMEVPGFNFGEVTIDQLYAGHISDPTTANIENQLNLKVRDTRDRTDYLGWKLDAEISEQFKSTANTLDGATVALKNANIEEDTILINPNTVLKFDDPVPIASVGTDEEAASIIDRSADLPIGTLDTGKQVLPFTPNENFAGVVTWTLATGLTTINGL